MKRPRKHLFIATPSHSGQVCCEYTKSLILTLPALAQNGIVFTHSFLMNNAIIQDARNRMVADFMASGATDLLFIDADISWEPEDAIRLALSPHDVIGGAYRQKREDAEMYNIGGMKPGGQRLIEVDYLGTGFLKISRRAIEKLTKIHQDTKYQNRDGSDCYGLFDVEIANGRITGEDALFCRRWNAAGGKVFLDPNMTLWHIGSKAYRGNFGELIARAEKKAGEAA